MNAYILDWTMNEYDKLKQKLTEQGFVFKKEENNEHVRVAVPFEKINGFSQIVQAHLNATHNYVDIQYPDKKQTVVIFQEKQYNITNDQENEEAKQWAISIGLPVEQADWPTSY